MLKAKYQPKSIKELIGQEVVKTMLTSVMDLHATKSMYPALLFWGIRGLGKTLSARLFAQTINCTNKVQNHTPCYECNSCKSIMNNTTFDFREIDAARYNGVENIRFIVENTQTPKELNYRVYLIDECHMLTEESFNCLLKTLENPPEGVIFILATTEIDKIPKTVQSRCLQFFFKPVELEKVINYTKNILEKEAYNMDQEAFHLIASLSGGSIRDLMVLLEKAILCKVKSPKDCMEVFGCCSYKDILEIYLLILDGKKKQALEKWNDLRKKGCDQRFFLEGLLFVVSHCITCKDSEEQEDGLVFFGCSIPENVREINGNFLSKHWEIIVYLLGLKGIFEYSPIFVKLSIIFLCHLSFQVGDECAFDYLQKLLPLGNLRKF